MKHCMYCGKEIGPNDSQRCEATTDSPRVYTCYECCKTHPLIGIRDPRYLLVEETVANESKVNDSVDSAESE